MGTPIAVEMFPLGEHLADELDARGWSQAEFAAILNRPPQSVSEVVTGKKEITRESAAQIGAALGTSAEFWLNLQDSYLLWKQAQDENVRANLDAVKTRARLQELVPMSLLLKRGYVKSADLEGQKREVLDLLGMQSFGDEPAITFAARRSNGDEKVTVLQRAWVACVKLNASGLKVAPYDPKALENLARGLSSLARDPGSFEHFQSQFAEVGVKLVYVQAFPGGKLDGCAMLVDGTPVIGISGRGKRLDIVLFTILHEVAHVLLGHLEAGGEVIVDDLSEEGPDAESAADQLASELAISQALPVVPRRISARWVREQADKLDVHPITLVGRLQKEGSVSWKSTLVRGAPTVIEQLESWAAPIPA